MQLSINLSESVKVKLTSFGEAVLAQFALEEYRRKGGVLSRDDEQSANEASLKLSFTIYNRDENGYFTFRFIDFCEIFGPVMSAFASTHAVEDATVLFRVPDGQIKSLLARDAPQYDPDCICTQI